MNEIEKLYKLARIKLRCRLWCRTLEMPSTLICDGVYNKKECSKCRYGSEHIKNMQYPEFTVEKQIALENIIFQCNFGICELQRKMLPEFTKDNIFVKHYFAWQYHAGDIGYYDETTRETYDDWDVEYTDTDRAEALAGFINNLWDEHLTSEEQTEIRKILE